MVLLVLLPEPLFSPKSIFTCMQDEKELFLLISKGDEKAFHRLFHLYNQKLVPFIYKLTRSDAATEEVVQEVFIKIWKHRQKLAEIEVPKAWITRVVSNQCYNFLRKQASEGRLIQYLKDRSENSSLSPEERLVAKETEAKIKASINQLPPRIREVYLLNKESGLTVEEIAEKLNISPNTVKNQLVTASKKLRNHLKSNLHSIVHLLMCG